MKLQHQIQSYTGCFQSPLKIEFVKFPIEKANLKKLGNAGLFKKKILHHVTNKTLDDLYKQFYKEYGIWFTTQVKKIIYPAKIKGIEKIICSA